MPTDKRYKLFDLMLDRVDLCPSGSNPQADIVLFKSNKEDDVPVAKKPTKTLVKADSRSRAKQRGDEDEDEDEDDDVIAKAEDEDEDEDVAGDEDDTEEEEDEAPARHAKARKVPPAKKSGKGGKGGGKKAAKPVKRSAAADEGLELPGEDDDDEDIELDDDVEPSEDEEDDVPEMIMKSLPKAARDFFQKQAARLRTIAAQAKRAEENVTVERTRRERIEAIEKAKATIPHLPGTDDEKASVLVAVAGLEKDVRKTLMTMLKAGNVAMGAEMFAESGRSSAFDANDDSAQAEIYRKADELMKVDKTVTSRSVAVNRICEQDRKLWMRYRAEMDNSRRRSH